MKTIAVYSKNPCLACGNGKELDNVATGARAAGLRHKAGLSQKEFAARMVPKISHQYLAFLEIGARSWTPKLIKSFEEALP